MNIFNINKNLGLLKIGWIILIVLWVLYKLNVPYQITIILILLLMKPITMRLIMVQQITLTRPTITTKPIVTEPPTEQQAIKAQSFVKVKIMKIVYQLKPNLVISG